MEKYLPALLRIALVMSMALAALFAAGILWHHGFELSIIRQLCAVIWLAFSVICIRRFLLTGNARALAFLAPPLSALLLWFVLMQPSNDRIWSHEMTKTLSYTRNGDIITLANVRNFNWTGPTAADERWETRTYDLALLKSVDVLSLYWKGPRIAHTYFSFVWTDGRALSLSIEIRKELGESYSPLGGFFKAYELSVLAGDERDFYGWRIFYPDEDIQIFRTNATPAQSRALLIRLLDLANDIGRNPVFYNTLTENCTTEVWFLTEAMNRGRPSDWRIFMSGYLPEFLYDLRILDTSQPLTKLREKSHILTRARSAINKDLTGPAFSAAIRQPTTTP